MTLNTSKATRLILQTRHLTVMASRHAIDNPPERDTFRSDVNMHCLHVVVVSAPEGSRVAVHICTTSVILPPIGHEAAYLWHEWSSQWANQPPSGPERYLQRSNIESSFKK